jgi:polysaccharide transporter, PST family
MTLIKTSILSAIAQIIRIVSGFVVTKVIAVYIGPSGLAVIGQLQNFINIVLIFAGDLFKTATTKYTAEYLDDSHKKYNLWSTTIKLILLLNIFIFCVLFFFSTEIVTFLLGNEKYSYILKILAFSIPFFVFNTFLLSILNGHRQIQKYILLSILLSLVSLFLVVLLSVSHGLKGALIAYTTNQSVVFFITIYVIRKETWFKFKNFTQKFNSIELKKLFGFALITLFAILASNLNLMVIRDFISTNISLESAGYWQGIWTLSGVSLSLITMSLTTYFLPTLSSLKNKNDISKELKKALILIIPIASFISLCMYLFRDFIIYILYTDEFLPMAELFLWQMIGNTIKVVGWLYGYTLVAKAMVKYTVGTEIVFALSFIFLSMLLVTQFGLIGVTYAFTINSVLHAVTVYTIYKYKV